VERSINKPNNNYLPLFSWLFYDLWFLAFPLQGMLLLFTEKKEGFFYFIVTYCITFWIAGFISDYINLDTIIRLSAIPSCIFTILYPFLPSYQHIFLAIIGISSALLMIRVGRLLHVTEEPILNAALGFILANIALAVLFWISIPIKILFIFIGLSLLLPVIDIKVYDIKIKFLNKIFYNYLPVLFLFYLLAGLLYLILMKIYFSNIYIKGIDLVFYIFAVYISYKIIISGNKDFALILAVICGFFALAFMHVQNRFSYNLSMFFIELAVGFCDIFSLALFLTQENPIKAYGFGMGSITLALLVGSPLLYTDMWLKWILIGGNISLACAIFVFYFVKYDILLRPNKVKLVDKIDVDIVNEQDTNSETRQKPIVIPSEFNNNKLFTQREIEVIEQVVQDKNIKEIAEDLQLAESTVKTYLHRIYKKAGLRNKNQLIDWIKLGYIDKEK